ncbi:MAG: hypothetical protein K6T65_10880 [Peptococcaceae bacterium]|nr:hypothetical protein [Peptococcaceae bacterium]
MKCSYHPEAEALDICPVCRRPVCDQCIVNLSGENYCKSCLEKKVSHFSSRPGPKSRFWALFFSLVPGGGYLYLGLMKRGLQTMVIFFGAFFLSSMANIEVMMAFVAPIVFFYSVFDTQQLLARINEGQMVEDRELFDWGSWQGKHNIIGAILIVVGLLALLNNLAPYLLPYYALNRVVPPLLIVGIGVYILYKNTAGKEEKANGNGKPED